jgi:5'-3' exonuclease
MKRRFLILDSNYLAHRAKHIFGELSDKGSATGVVYGFLKDILILRERFDTDRFIFCWDYGYNLRYKVYPKYKQNRKPKDYNKDEQEFEDAFQLQVNQLREIYLDTIGYKNIFYQEGYESDDVMAMVCQTLVPDLEEGIIVTADKDLLQLIRKNIKWYNPRTKELMSRVKFTKTYGISPRKWAKVKAIAGCTSDNVKGIEGVGDKTALQYLKGNLKKTTKAYKNIKVGWKSVVLRNRPLVELPYKGTKPVRLVEDKVTQKGWDKVTKTLGMRSIRYTKINAI